MNAFTLWKPASLTITQGLDNLAGFDKNPESDDDTVMSNRVWCQTCGGHLYTEHPMMGLINIPAAVITELKFEPAFNVHYQETAHVMKDGLRKFKDLSKEAGGSGIELQE